MGVSSAVDGSLLLKDIACRLGEFTLLGEDRKQKGIQHTLFLSKKPLTDTLTLDTMYSLNGYCSYCFVKSVEIIVGVLLATPTAKTRVTPHSCIVADREGSNFQPSFQLEKQGIIIFQSDDSLTLFVTESESSLLVEIE